MARKRLSDVIREETSKPAGVEGEQASNSVKDTVKGSPKGKGKARSNGNGAADRGAAADEAVPETDVVLDATIVSDPESGLDPKSGSDLTFAQSIDAAQGELIQELQVALDKAQLQEQALNQQVADLKADLKTQTSQAKKLQTQLEKTEQAQDTLEKELAEAKQTVLQLAESNSQLKDELNQLKDALNQKQNAAAKSAKPAPTYTSTHHALIPQSELQRQQARSLSHPVFPDGTLPGQLNDKDLGWVD